MAVTLSATVNKDATNKTVVWSSSDETVATIDPYSGKVTFKAAGKVVFTASACDGSEVTATVECNPTEANWTVSEWYTTDNTVDAETGAEGIANFGTNTSAYKDIKVDGNKVEYTFTNVAGQTINTSKGLKLNSSGMVSIAITKYAVLTLVIADMGLTKATPVVTNGVVTLTPISIVESQDGKTCTYVYEIEEVGMWDISRGDNSKENNPLLYAKCEYVDRIISENVGVTFKGSHYTEAKTNIANIITPSEAIDATNSGVEINAFKLAGCASNGSVTNWLVFQNNATITFKVTKACTVLVGYFSKTQTVTINGVEVEGTE